MANCNFRPRQLLCAVVGLLALQNVCCRYIAHHPAYPHHPVYPHHPAYHGSPALHPGYVAHVLPVHYQPSVYVPPGTFYDKRRGTLRTFPGGGVPVLVDNQKRCSNRFIGIKPHPSQPQYYYVCKPDCVVFGKCQHLQTFNATSGQCMPHPNSEFVPVCSKEGRFPIPNDCAIYYKCDRRLKAHIYSCPPHTTFSPTQGKCIKGNKCALTEISGGSQIPANCEDKFPPCVQNGTFRSPYDCSLYYTCKMQPNGVFLQTRLQCPVGNFYDVGKRCCRPISKVACDSIPVGELVYPHPHHPHHPHHPPPHYPHYPSDSVEDYEYPLENSMSSEESNSSSSGDSHEPTVEPTTTDDSSEDTTNPAVVTNEIGGSTSDETSTHMHEMSLSTSGVTAVTESSTREARDTSSSASSTATTVSAPESDSTTLTGNVDNSSPSFSSMIPTDGSSTVSEPLSTVDSSSTPSTDETTAEGGTSPSLSSELGTSSTGMTFDGTDFTTISLSTDDVSSSATTAADSSSTLGVSSTSVLFASTSMSSSTSADNTPGTVTDESSDSPSSATDVTAFSSSSPGVTDESSDSSSSATDVTAFSSSSPGVTDESSDSSSSATDETAFSSSSPGVTDESSDSPSSATDVTAISSSSPGVTDESSDSPSSATDETAISSSSPGVTDESSDSPSSSTDVTAISSSSPGVTDESSDSPSSSTDVTAISSSSPGVTDESSDGPTSATDVTAFSSSSPGVTDESSDSPSSSTDVTAISSSSPGVTDESSDSPSSATDVTAISSSSPGVTDESSDSPSSSTDVTAISSSSPGVTDESSDSPSSATDVTAISSSSPGVTDESSDSPSSATDVTAISSSSPGVTDESSDSPSSATDVTAISSSSPGVTDESSDSPSSATDVTAISSSSPGVTDESSDSPSSSTDVTAISSSSPGVTDESSDSPSSSTDVTAISSSSPGVTDESSDIPSSATDVTAISSSSPNVTDESSDSPTSATDVTAFSSSSPGVTDESSDSPSSSTDVTAISSSSPGVTDESSDSPSSATDVTAISSSSPGVTDESSDSPSSATDETAINSSSPSVTDDQTQSSTVSGSSPAEGTAFTTAQSFTTSSSNGTDSTLSNNASTTEDIDEGSGVSTVSLTSTASTSEPATMTTLQTTGATMGTETDTSKQMLKKKIHNTQIKKTHKIHNKSPTNTKLEFPRGSRSTDINRTNSRVNSTESSSHEIENIVESIEMTTRSLESASLFREHKVADESTINEGGNTAVKKTTDCAKGHLVKIYSSVEEYGYNDDDYFEYSEVIEQPNQQCVGKTTQLTQNREEEIKANENEIVEATTDSILLTVSDEIPKRTTVPIANNLILASNEDEEIQNSTSTLQNLKQSLELEQTSVLNRTDADLSTTAPTLLHALETMPTPFSTTPQITAQKVELTRSNIPPAEVHGANDVHFKGSQPVSFEDTLPTQPLSAETETITPAAFTGAIKLEDSTDSPPEALRINAVSKLFSEQITERSVRSAAINRSMQSSPGILPPATTTHDTTEHAAHNSNDQSHLENSAEFVSSKNPPTQAPNTQQTTTDSFSAFIDNDYGFEASNEIDLPTHIKATTTSSNAKQIPSISVLSMQESDSSHFPSTTLVPSTTASLGSTETMTRDSSRNLASSDEYDFVGSSETHSFDGSDEIENSSLDHAERLEDGKKLIQIPLNAFTQHPADLKDINSGQDFVLDRELSKPTLHSHMEETENQKLRTVQDLATITQTQDEGETLAVGMKNENTTELLELVLDSPSSTSSPMEETIHTTSMPTPIDADEHFNSLLAPKVIKSRALTAMDHSRSVENVLDEQTAHGERLPPPSVVQQGQNSENDQETASTDPNLLMEIDVTTSNHTLHHTLVTSTNETESPKPNVLNIQFNGSNEAPPETLTQQQQQKLVEILNEESVINQSNQPLVPGPCDSANGTIPKLEIKVYRPLDLHIVFCPESCNKTHVHNYDRPAVGLTWIPQKSNNTLSLQTAK